MDSISTQSLIHVSGLVQGVFYRANARDEGLKLGLTGYAKNLPDGRVEILAQGPKPAIEEFIKWCHEGSPSAKVQKVEVKWLENEENQTPPGTAFKGFETY